MRGGCTVDCGLHSPASGASACTTISPLIGVQMIQANTCKVHLKETVKINPSAKRKKHSNHSPDIGRAMSPSRISYC